MVITADIQTVKFIVSQTYDDQALKVTDMKQSIEFADLINLIR